MGDREARIELLVGGQVVIYPASIIRLEIISGGVEVVATRVDAVTAGRVGYRKASGIGRDPSHVRAFPLWVESSYLLGCEC